MSEAWRSLPKPEVCQFNFSVVKWKSCVTPGSSQFKSSEPFFLTRRHSPLSSLHFYLGLLASASRHLQTRVSTVPGNDLPQEDCWEELTSLCILRCLFWSLAVMVLRGSRRTRRTDTEIFLLLLLQGSAVLEAHLILRLSAYKNINCLPFKISFKNSTIWGVYK